MFTNTIKVTNTTYTGYISKNINSIPIASETHSCMIGSRMSASNVNRNIYPIYPQYVKSVTLCVGWDQYGTAYINGSVSSSEHDDPMSGDKCGTRNLSYGTTSVYISSSGETVDSCWYRFNYK